jgi:hypothetical protein
MIKPGTLVEFRTNITKYYQDNPDTVCRWHRVDSKLGIVEKRILDRDGYLYIIWIQDCLERVTASALDFDVI